MPGQSKSCPMLTCAECNAELPVDAPQGLCPRCLMNVGIGLSAGRPADLADSSVASAASSPAGVTRCFGDYELLEEIARGGMGIVFKARQVKLDRLVAVKMILAGQFASREQALRFRVEAEAAARLLHPNIVSIHETGEFDGQLYFSMDYVDGGNLGALVREKPLPAKRAAGYVKTIAGAIHHAHEQGILHRDLKPSNVLIDSSGQPRVTDFGLAKRMQKESFLTVTGDVMGSPNFMPPEQAGAKAVKAGRYSDVYSLGGILFYLVTGRPPFVAESIAETLHQVLNAEPVSPRLLNPGVPEDIATICLKCLEKEPAKRYQTARQLADELDRFLGGEAIQARPVSRVETLWRWCRRKPVVASLGAATVLLLLTVAIGSPIAAFLINRERQFAEEARKNETILRQQAETRERFVKAQALCDHLKFEEAEKLVSGMPVPALHAEAKDAAIVFSALADFFGRSGRWKEAAVDAAKAVECEPNDMHYSALAPLLVITGESENYRRCCREILIRFEETTGSFTAERMAKACLIVPLPGAELTIVEKLAETALTSGRSNSYLPYFQFAKGFVEYRQGRFASAADWARKSIDNPFYGDGHSRFVQAHMVLAMSQSQLKQPDKARTTLAKGIEIARTKLPTLDSGDLGSGWHWKDWIIAHVLMNEAKALIEGQSAPIEEPTPN